MTLRILVRGGGDLASGVVTRLHRAGWQVIVAELARPLAVRRYVAFAQAAYDGEIVIEEIRARLVENFQEAQHANVQGTVPVMVDPELSVQADFQPHVLVDGRMRKKAPELPITAAPLVVGLGPGFTAGKDCHAVIETNRGPFLGRVIWQGQAQPDTGIPERVGEYRAERVLRAPIDGTVEPLVEIGALVRAGEAVARVAGRAVFAPFDGVLRGLLSDGLIVRAGEKIGDVDPRGDTRLSRMVSDKALAIGGGVVEAILSWQPLRQHLYVEDDPERDMEHSRNVGIPKDAEHAREREEPK
jgi:xanthine dehydrogenase accessory factor